MLDGDLVARAVRLSRAGRSETETGYVSPRDVKIFFYRHTDWEIRTLTNSENGVDPDQAEFIGDDARLVVCSVLPHSEEDGLVQWHGAEGRPSAGFTPDVERRPQVVYLNSSSHNGQAKALGTSGKLL